MPRYRHALRSPVEHLDEGERWPNGRLEAGSLPEALHAQAVAQRLHYHMQGRTNKEVAALAGVTETALGSLMRGRTRGALPVLICLENALQTDLWCGRPHLDHLTPPAEPTNPTRVNRPPGTK